MATHTILSESEEMYLVTVARLVESGQAVPTPVALLACELDIAPVSANQMVRKLEENHLVCYTPYKGVELTEAGWQAALHILRHRRLWEVFLVERLQYAPKEAEILACRLEHALPPEAAARLSAFLGHPTSSPQGQPIPTLGGVQPLENELSLVQVLPGQVARVTRLACDPAARGFLAARGILPGSVLHILAAAGDNLLVEAGGTTIHLAPELVKTIWVQSTTSPQP
jgi:DtxR family Mn-dependent transcriptional regulator